MSDQSPSTIETATAVHSWHDGMVEIVIKQDADVTLQEAETNHAATARLAGDRDFLVLVDSRPARSISREARQFLADQEKRKHTIAQAIIIDSGISRVLGNFFIGLNRPAFPVRLFTSREAAIEWLKECAR